MDGPTKTVKCSKATDFLHFQNIANPRKAIADIRDSERDLNVLAHVEGDHRVGEGNQNKKARSAQSLRNLPGSFLN